MEVYEKTYLENEITTIRWIGSQKDYLWIKTFAISLIARHI